MEPRTVVETIEGASKETSADLHECWVNLLAQEMSGWNIHPEIPRILARMTSEDGKLLTVVQGHSHFARVSAMLHASHKNDANRMKGRIAEP